MAETTTDPQYITKAEIANVIENALMDEEISIAQYEWLLDAVNNGYKMLRLDGILTFIPSSVRD